MRDEQRVQAQEIEGYFQRTVVTRTGRYALPGLMLVVLLVATGFATRSPFLLAAALLLGVLLYLKKRLNGRIVRVKVRLHGTEFTAIGDGYDIQLKAPFRYKTGVARISSDHRGEETCFIRMVIDVDGKPIVLEEEVLPGYYPPQLDEIVGISGALGIAELTSLTPYPGTLWSLIESMESMAEDGANARLEENIKSLFRIGRQQLADKQYQEAIDTFNTIIRQNPDSPTAYYNRGAARYYAREELDKAVNDLTTALRLEPHQHKAYRMRGLVRGQQGNWAGLRDDCSLALKFHPTSAELFNLRGTACYRLQDYESALTNFENAVRLDPNRHESFYNRGLAKQRLGSLAEAVEDFQNALGLNPLFVEAERNLEAVRKQLAQIQANSQP